MSISRTLSNKKAAAEPTANNAQRRLARSVVLQTLFESDVVDHDPKVVLQRHIDQDELDTDAIRFARLLLAGITDKKTELDKFIAVAAPHWPVDQMAKVDKNILRLAIFEILFHNHNDVPVKAAINEAIELAKSYGSDSSSRFVNGVLGAIVKQNDSKQAPTQKQREALVTNEEGVSDASDAEDVLEMNAEEHIESSEVAEANANTLEMSVDEDVESSGVDVEDDGFFVGVRDVIAEQKNISDLTLITAATSLVNDLAVNQFQLRDSIQAKYSITITEDEIEDLQTVQQVIDLVRAKSAK